MENSRAFGNCDIRHKRNRTQKKSRTSAQFKRIRTLAAGFSVIGVLGGIQLNFVKNGGIAIDSSGYTAISDEMANHAEVAEALSMASDKSDMRIDIDVPDNCPVNYTAYSPIAIVYDKSTGKVLYAKNETEKCFPASTAKLLTAAVALDLAPADYNFIAGTELDLLPEGASRARINKCYSMNKEQLIDGIILKGGSDVSYTAAANIGRLMFNTDDVSSEDALRKFVEFMNATANDLGVENTHFTNADGHSEEDNYTTAKDMLRIAVYASEHKEIMDSAGKESANGKLASGQVFEWVNTNKMVLSESDDYYEYATGLKTGMTGEAGYCIAASAKCGGHELICIVMESDSDDHRTTDVTNLFDLSFEYLSNLSDNADSDESEIEA